MLIQRLVLLSLACWGREKTNSINNMSSTNFRIVSCWSKAGVGTSIVLEYGADTSSEKESLHKTTGPKKKRGARVVLDIGATPCYDESIDANTVLVSHGHVDHIGAIFSHARSHAVLKSGSIPTYYVPEPIVSSLEQARTAMSALDAANDGTGSRKSGLIQMNIVGVHPGDEIMLPIKKRLNGVRLFTRVFGAEHAGCPAVGYVIGSRRAPQLKDKYRGLPSKEIRELIASGVNIKSQPPDVLEVSYTGDTSIDGLRQRQETRNGNELILQEAFQCPLMLCEATFLEDDDHERQLARDRGHMHIDDVGTVMADQNPNLDSVTGEKDRRQAPASPHLVLWHLSARYGATQAMDHVARVISQDMIPGCSVAISSLLQDEEEWSHLIQPNGCIRLSDYISYKLDHKSDSMP